MHKGSTYLAGNYFIYNYYESENTWREIKDHRINVVVEDEVFKNAFGQYGDNTLCAI